MSFSTDFRNRSFSECLEAISKLKLPYVVKRLSGNDTGLTGGHQAGVYLPRVFFERTVPEINSTTDYNPRADIHCYLPVNGGDAATLSAIYYNSRFFPERGLKKKYNEFRLTGWGGATSPVQNEENTGCVFVFAVMNGAEGVEAVALVAESLNDENLIEEWLGRSVEPAEIILSEDISVVPPRKEAFPSEWLDEFPNGRTLFNHVVDSLPRAGWGKSLDELLLKRRSLEYQIYGAVESAHVMPSVSAGFGNVDEFMKLALSVANRRKSRTGSSLEYNLAAIFTDEKINFADQVVTEHRKKPDFIFPSEESYRDLTFESKSLTMLAAKTCCKDRWRQVLSEANRIEKKHLFTLQEGVSPNQLLEMEAGGLQLVVPEPNLKSFSKEWRGKILNLESFVRLVRGRQACG